MPLFYGWNDWMLLLPVLLLTGYAQYKVSSSFRRYSARRNCRGITGAQAAYQVLAAHGVTGVDIKPCRGHLTDHYNPRDNTIYLSEPVYGAATVAAVGVAAHEAGHAVQYAEGYTPVRARSAIIPISQFGSQFAVIALMIGLFLDSQSLFALGTALFFTTTLFQLFTLPVEFNASRRAVATIENSMLLEEDEQQGAKRVLSAAALTYVAALLTSIVQLMRYVLVFLSNRDRRNR